MKVTQKYTVLPAKNEKFYPPKKRVMLFSFFFFFSLFGFPFWDSCYEKKFFTYKFFFLYINQIDIGYTVVFIKSFTSIWLIHHLYITFYFF